MDSYLLDHHGSPKVLILKNIYFNDTDDKNKYSDITDNCSGENYGWARRLVVAMAGPIIQALLDTALLILDQNPLDQRPKWKWGANQVSFWRRGASGESQQGQEPWAGPSGVTGPCV